MTPELRAKLIAGLTDGSIDYNIPSFEMQTVN
mgnify:CR=1 FL=1